MNNMNSGYHGYAMSNRAYNAYENGEKPFSKWTKADILSALKTIYGEEMSEKGKRLSADTLKAVALVKTAYHHTGIYCNRTDFYAVRENLNSSDLEISENREKEEKPAERYALIKYVWRENRGSRNYPKMYTYSRYYIALISEKSACILSKKGEKCTYVKNYEIEKELQCFPRKNNKVWEKVNLPATEERERR